MHCTVQQPRPLEAGGIEKHQQTICESGVRANLCKRHAEKGAQIYAFSGAGRWSLTPFA